MNLGEAVIQALAERGAREIFGIPGDFALPFFKAVEESGRLPLYTLSHEPAVGFAADAAARFNCALGVAAVTYGAGAFNMVNAVAAAFAEKSPVVVISGAPGTDETTHGLLVHHQAKTLDSQFRVYREITCAQTRLDDPARAPAEIARVLAACRERSQPVYIEIPRDMVGAEIGPVPDWPGTPVDAEALAACADEILESLRAARTPVLMVGVEVRRFDIEARVAELARRLGLPVVTSFMGRGLLADSAAPPVGTYIGVAGTPEVTRLVEESDALFLLGVILSDTNFGISKRRIDMRHTIQALDRQVSLGYHVYPDIPLDRLVEALLERVPEAAGAARPRQARQHPRGLVADDAALTPTDVARGINDLMDRHGVMPIASDMGDCLFTAMDVQHTRMVAPGYYAGMGFGVPAGLGVQATTGERPLILVGDGAFQMTGWELGNCRRYGWDPIVVVFNNASWEMLRAFQPESRFNDLDDWRFADAAAALGGVGTRVRTRRAYAEALAAAVGDRGRFHLVEVMLERGALSDTLARFVAAFREMREKGGRTS